MSADNSVARGGLDAQTQAEQAAFQIPPELATRYQVRIIEPSDGSERRVGMFLPTDRENPSIEIAGDRIIARNEDPDTVSALVTIAKHNGWAGIDVEGSPEFRQAVWTAASREGLTVRGYEPSFDEQARMEELRRADAARRDREVAEKLAPTVEPVAPTAAVGATEATVLAPSADAERNGAPQPLPSGSSTELSDADKRLLLTVSVHTQDRKALYAAVSEDMDPLRREVQAERSDLNRDALNGALERALESPTLVSAFSRSGYEPDGLRQMARDGAWDGEVADAIYIVRSGLNRHEVAREAGANVPLADALEPVLHLPGRPQVRNILPNTTIDASTLLSGDLSNIGSLGSLASGIQSRYALPATSSSDADLAYNQALKDATSSSAATAALGENTLSIAQTRMQGLDQLREQLSYAKDPKDVMDLQARISVEQAQLQNDMLKMQAIQMAQAGQANMQISAAQVAAGRDEAAFFSANTIRK